MDIFLVLGDTFIFLYGEHCHWCGSSAYSTSRHEIQMVIGFKCLPFGEWLQPIFKFDAMEHSFRMEACHCYLKLIEFKAFSCGFFPYPSSFSYHRSIVSNPPNIRGEKRTSNSDRAFNFLNKKRGLRNQNFAISKLDVLIITFGHPLPPPHSPHRETRYSHCQ